MVYAVDARRQIVGLGALPLEVVGRDVPDLLEHDEVGLAAGGHPVDDDVRDREVRSVLVEGGASVLGGFLRAGLVDRLDVHVAPVLLGAAGRPLLDGPWATTLADAPRFTPREVVRSGDDAVLSVAPVRVPEEV